jgi:hypothetical protein
MWHSAGDVVVVARDGGDRHELRCAALVKCIGVSTASSGQIQSSGLIDTGHDRGNVQYRNSRPQ